MAEKQERRLYGDFEEFHSRKIIHTSKKNIIMAGELACLSIILYDNAGANVISNTDYRIEGHNGKAYSGTTDDNGYLFHPDVPIDDYDLTVGDITVKVPVVLNQNERHLQRVIDYVIP